MHTKFNHSDLFSALTLFTLGSLQMPVMAISNDAAPLAKQEPTAATFRAQGSVKLAQASNCRKVKDADTFIFSTINGTGAIQVLAQGTSVEVNLGNSSGDFIQVNKPRPGFVNKKALTLCSTPPPPKGIHTGCLRVRNLQEIRNMGGLPLRQEASLQGATAFSKLQVGAIFRVTKPQKALENDGIKWIEIVSPDGIIGYVSDGPSNSSERNLEPITCPK